MKAIRILAALCILSWGAPEASSQTRSVRDSALTSSHLHLSLGATSTYGDLADRMGYGGLVGLGFHVKQRSNLYWGLSAHWGFGHRLVEQGVLSNLLTPAGELIDNEGQVAYVGITGRSGLFTADVGWLWNDWGPNPNSGILVLAGMGSFHHRLHFENTENRITQLEPPQLGLYDRLSWGVAGRISIGYFHMSNDGLRNFHVNLFWMHANTWSQRPFHADLQLVEEDLRRDGVMGLSLGWAFHMYKRAPKEHWY